MKLYWPIYFVVLVQIGCSKPYELHNLYEVKRDASGIYENENATPFVRIDNSDSTFVMGFMSLGGVDTVSGYFVRKKNSLFLRQFYANHQIIAYDCPVDTVCMQFFARGDGLPFLENWPVVLNNVTYKLDPSGMVKVPRAVFKMTYVHIQETALFCEGKFLLGNDAKVLHQVELESKGPFMSDMMRIRIRENSLKIASRYLMYTAN